MNAQTCQKSIGLQWVSLLQCIIKSDLSSEVLHPHHKLQYFKTMNWEEDWIKMAKEIVRAEYSRTYANRAHKSCRSPGQPEISRPQMVTDKVIWSNIPINANWRVLQTLKQRNTFDDLPALIAPAVTGVSNAINTYLATPCKSIIDALAWWNECCETYPGLSCMALDYLSIPGMLSSSYRCFLLTDLWPKPLPLMWRVHSVVVTFWFHMSGAAFMSKLSEHSCVSKTGVSRVS